MNNTSNNVSLSSIEEQSLANLRKTLIINILVDIVLCLLTTLSNVGTIAFMIKGGKTFSTNHYKLIMHSSLAASVEAFYSFCIYGAVRVSRTVIGIPENTIVLHCALLVLPAEICWTVKQINVLQIAADRLFAVMCPMRYRNYGLSKISIIIVLGISWVVAAIDEGVKFGLYTKTFSETLLSICAVGNTNPPIYFTFRNTRNIVTGALTLIIYLAAVVLVKRQVTNSNSKLLKKEVGYKLMITSGVDAVIYTFTLFLAQIYGLIVIPSSNPQSRIFLTPIAFTFVLLSTTPRFLVYYCLNKDFKVTVNKYCFCSSRQNNFATEPTSFSTNQNNRIEIVELQKFNRQCKRRLALKGIEKYQGFMKPSVAEK